MTNYIPPNNLVAIQAQETLKETRKQNILIDELKELTKQNVDIVRENLKVADKQFQTSRMISIAAIIVSIILAVLPKLVSYILAH